jgi:hypothetical protein
MLPYHKKLLSAVGSGGGGALEVNAVTFNGSTRLLRGADLTGLSDGKQGTISFWIKLDSTSGQMVYKNLNGRVRLQFGGDGKIYLLAENSSSSLILFLNSDTAYTPSDGWLHVIASWDLAATTAYLYVNDSNDDVTPTTVTNDTIDYTSPNHEIGSDDGSSSFLDSDLAEYYFATEYVDISSETERRKFITADGKPADLGADGSTPTGTSPVMYLSNRPGDSASDFATNRGTGGDFSITGTLTTATTSPSD